MRSTFALVAGAVLALIVPAIARPASVQGQVQVVGRYQVVNDTPGMPKSIMSLDTISGESWAACGAKEEEPRWCKIPRSDTALAAKK